MSVSVSLYQNTDNELVANKTLSATATVSGTLVESADFLTPTITIEITSASIVEEANYFSMTDSITRYYSIESKVAVTDTLWRITGRADLRKTYYYNILGAQGIVNRQENLYDMYLPDDKVPIGAHKPVNTYKFSSTPFKGGSDNRVVMLVMGGG